MKRTDGNNVAVRSAKECAYLALFVALQIAAQLLFSALPGVEIVTLLFISYSFVFGVRRGVLAATAFALLRQAVFGVYPTVLVLYLVYYNGLCALFGGLGHAVKKPLFALWWLVIVAALCTAVFSMMDNLLTPLWYGYPKEVLRTYFFASFSFMIPQVVCTAITMSALFLPLQKTFSFIKRGLGNSSGRGLEKEFNKSEKKLRKENMRKLLQTAGSFGIIKEKGKEKNIMTYQQAKALLEEKGQTQLLTYYDELDEAGKAKLLTAIENINWEFEDALANPVDMSGKDRDIHPISGLRLTEIEKRKAEFEKLGAEAIKAGKVAAVLLAGGMGTRLGVDGPKGAYDIGITKPLYIFEQQMRNLQEVTEKCGAIVPLYIMTSDKNHEQTTSFWKEHNYFGYPESEVKFFKQEMAPAVDYDGKIILERKDTPALSPNGNGGWFSSLQKAGLCEDLHARGVEWLNIYAVDNVLQRIADPVFVGATIDSGVNCGAKVICKNNPYEKVGVLCMDGDQPDIIEYYELTEEMANQKDENGELAYIYGAIMNYLFRLSKLEEIVDKKIPVHIVEKKIECLCADGETRKPEKENGKKFETLAVDLIKPMGSVLPFEVVREKEFAPIKNKTGVDSVESARELLKGNGVIL